MFFARALRKAAVVSLAQNLATANSCVALGSLPIHAATKEQLRELFFSVVVSVQSHVQAPQAGRMSQGLCLLLHVPSILV
eukprot:359947-Amphidinium_carterae.1